AGEPGGARRRAPETGPGSAHRVDVFEATSVGRRAHPRNDPRSENPISRIGNVGHSKAPTCRNGGPAFRVDTGAWPADGAPTASDHPIHPRSGGIACRA